MTNDIVLFETKDKSISLPVQVTDDTVWLTQTQMTELFSTTKQNISLHINNCFKEKELDKNSVVKDFLTTASDGKSYRTNYYNLDVIISVGYRVKSQRGVEFRRWANGVLKQYILNGVAVNNKRLENLGKTVELQSRIIAHINEIDTDDVLKVINRYTEALNLLDDYDHQCVKHPKGTKTAVLLTTEECHSIINKMRFGGESELFGTEKEDGKLDGILGAVYQSVFGEDVYPSVEEKAANLLYLTVKDHPFNDGCKRIAATLFLAFLQKNGMLVRKDGTKLVNNGTLAAITLLVAESEPEEKNIMISLIMNMIKMA